MKLIIDMKLSPKWAGFLRDAGFEALHWSEIGAANALDVDILDHARRNGFVILTHDLDFGAILAATAGTSPSVVQLCSDNLSIKAIGSTVLQALIQLGDALTEGALVTVDANRARLTVLPIGSSNKPCLT